jgi:hypothetical protein
MDDDLLGDVGVELVAAVVSFGTSRDDVEPFGPIRPDMFPPGHDTMAQ